MREQLKPTAKDVLEVENAKQTETAEESETIKHLRNLNLSDALKESVIKTQKLIEAAQSNAIFVAPNPFRTFGFNDGVEEAAKLFDAKVKMHSKCATWDMDGRPTNGPAMATLACRDRAEEIRALKRPM